jgi:HlyD family secretion protein
MPLTGKVVRIEPVSDSVTEERITLITFDQIPPGLSIGEMAEVTVQTAANQSGLTLPNAAIKQTPEGSWCLETTRWQARLCRHQTRHQYPGWLVQVLEGLGAGDEIIVYSERELSEGSRVKVVEQLAGQRK